MNETHETKSGNLKQQINEMKDTCRKMRSDIEELKTNAEDFDEEIRGSQTKLKLFEE